MTIHFGTDGWRAVISDTFTFHNLRLVAQAIADAVASTEWLNGSAFGVAPDQVIYFLPLWAQGTDLGSHLPNFIIEETNKPGGPAIVYGVVLILVMFFLPNGVGGLFRRIGQLLTRRR